MQVKIDNNCFQNTSNAEDLDAIFSLFKSGQHKWIDIDLEDIQKSSWYNELGNKDKFHLNKLVASSTRKSNGKKTISVSENNPSIFSVFEAVFFLKQPLKISVENSEYEPQFINTLIQEFDYSREIKYAMEMQWVKYENAGGSNNNAISGELQNSFNHPFLTKNKSVYLRYFVIKDSDREYCVIQPNGEIVEQVLPESKTKFLKGNNIPYHILYKREKENYMPDLVYQIFLSDEVKKAYAQAYLSLNNHQKDFLDIERGFLVPKSNPKRVKEKKDLPTEVKQLYQHVSNENYQILGLGLPYNNIKASFSKEFNGVSKADLVVRINHQPLIKSKYDDVERNEFEHIIHEIKYLL